MRDLAQIASHDVDDCRRMAQEAREKAEGLAPVHDAERIVELLETAARWDARAAR